MQPQVFAALIPPVNRDPFEEAMNEIHQLLDEIENHQATIARNLHYIHNEIKVALDKSAR
jgi:hypothetical protein